MTLRYLTSLEQRLRGKVATLDEWKSSAVIRACMRFPMALLQIYIKEGQIYRI